MNTRLTKVWVQVTSGGHPFRASFQEMFLDPMFLELEVIPYDHPQTFANVLGAPPSASVSTTGGKGALGGAVTLRVEPPDYPWEPSGGRPHPGFDVQVLYDQLNWPETARKNAQKAVEAGKGIVVISHALGDNQDWPWWREEVTGGMLVLDDRDGMKKSTITAAAALDVRPAAKHPILRDVGPFHLVREEAYSGMWQSPKITPLLATASPGSDKTIAWIGPSRTAHVVVIQPGAARETHRNREYRKLVRNAILWCGGRI
jgi:hypothetical protein